MNGKIAGTLLTVLFVCAAVYAQEPLTFSDAYAMALKQSEDIGLKKELMSEAQAHFYQSLSIVLPKVDFVMTRFDQDASAGAVSSSGNPIRGSTQEKKFVFSQPLFSGFKEFAALQASGAEKEQRRQEYERAKDLLLVDVSDAFYNALKAQKDEEVFAATKELLQKRLAELEGRVKLGRSRDSEMQTSRIDFSIAESDLEEARRAKNVAISLLEFYVGEKIDGPLDDSDNLPEEVDEINERLAAVDTRPDVKAAHAAKALADNRVVAARAGLFPKIFVDGNYYTQRRGPENGVDWDVLLTFGVPIFEGTEVIGDIQEAGAKRGAAALVLSKTERLARYEIEAAHENLSSLRRQEKALRQASEASAENYKILSQEYLNNLVNNLEVLDALRRSQEMDLRLNAARASARRNYWKWVVAIGEKLDLGAEK